MTQPIEHKVYSFGVLLARYITSKAKQFTLHGCYDGDYEWLRFIKNSLGLRTSIIKMVRDGKVSWRLDVTDTNVLSSLRTIKQLDSLEPVAEKLNNELLKVFLYGFCDGRGSIVYAKNTSANVVNFTSTFNIVNQIKDLLGKVYEINNPYISKGRYHYTLKVAGYHQSKQIIDTFLSYSFGRKYTKNRILEKYHERENLQHGSKPTYNGTFDKTFFRTIDNPIKAYWLGVLVADGYVVIRDKLKSFFGIDIAVSDKDWIELFRQDINSTYPVHIYETQSGQQYICGHLCNCQAKASLRLYDNDIVLDLMRIGVEPNKTFNEKFPNIPEQYYPDFIRGWFDGDGSVSLRKDGQLEISFCGGYNICETVQKILIENCNLNKAKISFTTIYQFKYGGNRCVRRIYDYLYYDPNVRCLQRKRNVFKKVFK